MKLVFNINKDISNDNTTLTSNIDLEKDDINLDVNERAALDCLLYDKKDDVAGNTQQQSRTEQANSKCTAKDVVEVGEEMCHSWQRLVLKLSAKFFMNKVDIVENGTVGDCFNQSFKALRMRTNEFGEKTQKSE